MGHGHFKAVAAHKLGAVGIQQVAELCGAALLGQAADDLVSRHAQRHGAVAGFVMAEVALALFDEQLGTGPTAPAKAQHGHPASVGGDLQGGGAALVAGGLRFFTIFLAAALSIDFKYQLLNSFLIESAHLQILSAK